MESKRLRLTATDWIQVVATFAIVVSIILVLIELRQSREIAEAQLISDQYTIEAGLLHATLGENPANALAKSCEHPGELTREDTEVLDAWYQSKLILISRQRHLAGMTGFYDRRVEWEGSARASLIAVLGTPYGRQVWANSTPFF